MTVQIMNTRVSRDMKKERLNVRERERERVRERDRNKLRNITLIVVGASKNINQILALKQDLF